MTPISRLTLRLQSDARLVELAAGGREPAFDAIVDRYHSPLLRYCARLLPFDRAEDVVQQTFERAYAAFRNAEPPHRLRPWLYRIAHNLAVNTLAKNGWDYDQLDENYDGVPQPPDIVVQREQLARVVNQMQGLPDRQRSALVMHVLEGHSYEEIAAELSATPSMVRQLLYRARTHLRDGLGLLIPIPLMRAKVGASLFAAATIAGGAGVAVQQRGDHHSRSDNRPNATQPAQKPGPPAHVSAAAVPAKPTSKDDRGGGESSHVQVAVRSEGGGSSGPDDTATEPDRHQGGDEEADGRYGSSGDRDEEGTEARLPTDGDGEHADSEHGSGDGGSENRSGDRSGEGSGGDSGHPSDEPTVSESGESDGSP
jgi:RNA polymerase sigma-70 factor (ECF subfamily)